MKSAIKMSRLGGFHQSSEYNKFIIGLWFAGNNWNDSYYLGFAQCEKHKNNAYWYFVVRAIKISTSHRAFFEGSTSNNSFYVWGYRDDFDAWTGSAIYYPRLARADKHIMFESYIYMFRAFWGLE